MRNLKFTWSLLFLFFALNVGASNLHFHPDSLYIIRINTTNSTAATALRDVVAVEGELEDEVPDSDMKPTFDAVCATSHAQLWQFESVSDTSFVMKNFKTGRYLWTDYCLPQAGESWSQAQNDASWVYLASASLVSELYMGPNADDLGLSCINSFTAHLWGSSNAISPANYVFPSDDWQSIVMNPTLVAVEYGWLVEPVALISEVGPDMGGDTTKLQEVSVSVVVNKLFSSDECYVYSASGQLLVVFTGETVLSGGFYLLKNKNSAVQKVLIAY